MTRHSGSPSDASLWQAVRVQGTSRQFDGFALYSALEARRFEKGLTLTGVAREVWNLSATLNSRRPTDHPFSTSAIESLRRRGNTSCQHALLLLWWLESSPEEFVADAAPGTESTPLPQCDDAHRLRWNLGSLHSALDTARISRGTTWSQLAASLGYSPGQLSGLRTARYSTNMRLAMSLTQLMRRPAADFIYPANW